MKEEEHVEESEYSDYDHLYNALKRAHKAFFDYFDEMGLDAAFWELEPLTGHILNSNDFTRWGKITLDTEEGKKGTEDDE